MPFTTRPAVTSRQGMMRFASILDQLHEVTNDLQADGSRLLRMELDAEHIVLFEDCCVRMCIRAGSRCFPCNGDVVAVSEVDVRMRPQTRQQPHRLGGVQNIPPHM